MYDMYVTNIRWEKSDVDIFGRLWMKAKLRKQQNAHDPFLFSTVHKNCIHVGAKPSTIIFSWPQIDVCRAQRIRIAFIIGGRVSLKIKAGRDSISVILTRLIIIHHIVEK